MTRPAEGPDAVLRYAAHEDGLVDVHLPPGPLRPSPLVVFVHGGFWRQAYDRRHARPLADALALEGFVVAVPEYRRVGGAGGWPATGDDVDAALGALPGLLAGIGVETTTTTLVGHSAGGHLVLWLANQPHPVDRVVALGPGGAAARGRGGRDGRRRHRGPARRHPRAGAPRRTTPPTRAAGCAPGPHARWSSCTATATTTYRW